MSDEEPDTVEVGKFAEPYPIWVLFRDSVRRRAPESGGVVPFRQPGVADAIPLLLVFGTEEKAKAFVDCVKVADLSPLKIGAAADFLPICKYHSSQGVRAVAVNVELPNCDGPRFAVSDIIKDIMKKSGA